MDTSDIIAGIIEVEGRTYTDKPHDRGGPTKFGITQKTLAAYRGHEVSPADVEGLTEAEAQQIYREEYILKPGFDALADPNVRTLAVDCGVLHGQQKAIEMLQRALGNKNPDGILGPITLTAANAFDGKRLFLRLVAERAEKFGRIITADPTQAENAHGWLRARVADFLRAVA